MRGPKRSQAEIAGFRESQRIAAVLGAEVRRARQGRRITQAALGRRIGVGLSRDISAEPADAGHLGIQELVLRLARAAGRTATFELPTRPADPRRSIDVGV